MNLQSVMTKMRTVTIFLCVIFVFFSCRQTVIEYNEIYQVRYITMEFTDTHGPGDILLSNGEWVLARDINKLTKERLDATPAIGVLVYEKEGVTNADPRIPVVMGLEILTDAKWSEQSVENTSISDLKGSPKVSNLASGKDSSGKIKSKMGNCANYPLFDYADSYSVEYNGVPEYDWYVPSITELTYAFIGKGGIETSFNKLHELDPDAYKTKSLDSGVYVSCNESLEGVRFVWNLTWSQNPNKKESGPGSLRCTQKSYTALDGLTFCGMFFHDFAY